MPRPRMTTVGRRARLMADLLSRPAELWLALRMAAWRLVLPILKRRLALPRLVRLMWREPSASAREPIREARIAELARVVYRSDHGSRRGNCLERSLVLYRYLASTGADPKLLVGVKRGDDALHGHAWVTVRETPLEEPPGSLDEFVQVVAFRRDGRLSHSGAPHDVPSAVS